MSTNLFRILNKILHYRLPCTIRKSSAEGIALTLFRLYGNIEAVILHCISTTVQTEQAMNRQVRGAGPRLGGSRFRSIHICGTVSVSRVCFFNLTQSTDKRVVASGIAKNKLQELSVMKKDEGEKIIMFCLFCNMFLLAMKGSIGLLSGSQALTADAVNSAGDVLSSLVVLFGVRYSLKASDEEHPYGHGKMEALVSMIVGILILASVVLLIRDVITTISSQTMSEPSFYALGAAAAAIAVKAFMYKKTASIGKRLNSIAVMTNAKDHRNDIYATSGTLVAIALSFIGQHYGVKVLSLYAEPALAVIMSVFIIKTAMEILIEASKMLLDAAPDKKTMSRMQEITEAAEGVKRLNWIKCRKMGRGLLVDTAIEVAGDISVEKGHAIADAVKTAIMVEYPEVLDVLVHINPEEQ